MSKSAVVEEVLPCNHQSYTRLHSHIHIPFLLNKYTHKSTSTQSAKEIRLGHCQQMFNADAEKSSHFKISPEECCHCTSYFFLIKHDLLLISLRLLVFKYFTQVNITEIHCTTAENNLSSRANSKDFRIKLFKIIQ